MNKFIAMQVAVFLSWNLLWLEPAGYHSVYVDTPATVDVGTVLEIDVRPLAPLGGRSRLLMSGTKLAQPWKVFRGATTPYVQSNLAIDGFFAASFVASKRGLWDGWDRITHRDYVTDSKGLPLRTLTMQIRTFKIPVPNEPKLVGYKFHFQAFYWTLEDQGIPTNLDESPCETVEIVKPIPVKGKSS